MKTVRWFCLFVCVLLYNCTLCAQEEGALGFSFKPIRVVDESDGKTYRLCEIDEVLYNSPAWKAKFPLSNYVILTINGRSMVVPSDSLDSKAYEKSLSTMLRCNVGDVVEIETTYLPHWNKNLYGEYIIKQKDDLFKSSSRINKYCIKAENRAELDGKWKEFLRFWDDGYRSYWPNPDDKKIQGISDSKVGSLKNPKLAKAFAKNVLEFRILIDSSSNNPINPYYIVKALEKKGYGAYLVYIDKNYYKNDWNSDLFEGYSINTLKGTAVIDLRTRVDVNTDNYSMDVSREYARYTDNYGNSITEYRPQKEKWTVTKRAINGVIYVTLPRRRYEGYNFYVYLKDIWAKKFVVKTGKSNYAEVALKSILAEIPDKE